MQIEHFIGRLDKTRQSIEGFEYKLGKRLQLNDFIHIERSLNIIIHKRIKDFYLAVNGLKTSNPDFELLEFDTWRAENGLIHFATFDNSNKVYFKISEHNHSGEWAILNTKDDYEITMTISSFWSNKIWHWVEQRKKIWTDNWWIE